MFAPFLFPWFERLRVENFKPAFATDFTPYKINEDATLFDKR